MLTTKMADGLLFVSSSEVSLYFCVHGLDLFFNCCFYTPCPKLKEIARASSDAKSHMQEGKKTLERELARAKISANRVASVVANEWKDANDKVMPVKQWLDERRFLQVSSTLY
jgi:hypothetical protein